MLTRDQIGEAVENLEAALDSLCEGQPDVYLGKADIGWVRIALRVLRGELPQPGSQS